MKRRLLKRAISQNTIRIVFTIKKGAIRNFVWYHYWFLYKYIVENTGIYSNKKSHTCQIESKNSFCLTQNMIKFVMVNKLILFKSNIFIIKIVKKVTIYYVRFDSTCVSSFNLENRFNKIAGKYNK